jgi:hypothetical protein
MAAYGHEATQIPHPEHISSSIDTGGGYPSFVAISFRTSHTLENFTFCGQRFSQSQQSEQYQIYELLKALSLMPRFTILAIFLGSS